VTNPYAEFDDYCEEHNVPMDQTSVAFGQWLADKTKAPVIGREVDGDGLTIALPDRPSEILERS
jgi:hypothetical protein